MGSDLEPRPLCRGTNRRGGPCQKPPIPGGTVCPAHGGKAPQVRAAAERRLALQQAEAHVAANIDSTRRLDLAGVYEEMLRTASLVVQWRDRWQERVDELQQIRYVAPGAGTEQVRAEVQLLERAMDRATRTLELIARLDLDSRVKRLNEDQGALVFRAVSHALDAGDLTPAQRDAVEAALAVELRRAAGGGR
ncbi:hypothetical protein DBB34_14565 [Sphaerisporangium cinnabarinum]|nr:hypothetical protein DBB34_14565 [Sphaerisporangium cinnabarinum]